MGIEVISDDVIFVTLSEYPHLSEDFVTVNENVTERGGCDVIIDFSKVKIMSSFSIGSLITLRELLRDYDHRLILCNVSVLNKQVFVATGLDLFFDFAVISS